ncbi:beta-lactamase/transpeptidase-like protein, partial [Aureobasidium melanogenum]
MNTSMRNRLEELIVRNNRNASHETAAAVLQDLGTACISFAILDHHNITSHCITSGSEDTSTLFQACSISKSVCALLTFKLIESGHLSLHTSISAYLPKEEVDKLETPETKGMAKFITISMLLSHTSGLETSGVYGFPGYDLSRNANGHFRAALPELKEALEGGWPSNTLPIRLKDWPDHNFNYSGGGYEILQLIIEEVMKKPLAQVMQEYVFTPLGMKRSTFAVPEDEDLNTKKQQGKGNYARAHYNGYTACEAPHRVNPEQSAAGLWSTPTDLLTLVSAIQKSLHDEGGFLPQNLAKQMLQEVMSTMAHGWFVTNTHFGHSGSNVPGWKCNVMASLDGNQGFCFMVNSLEGDPVGYKMEAAISYLLGWKKAKEFLYMKTCIPFADVSATPPDTAVMEKWNGMWKEKGTQFKVEFLAQEGVPCLKVGQMPEQWLWIAAHGEEESQDGSRVVADLVCRGGVEVLVRLIEDANGEALMEMWNGNTGKKVVMERVS